MADNLTARRLPVSSQMPPHSPSPNRLKPEFHFGALGRQIASRTTDLIVIGVVLIGGLTIGRNVVTWWRAEPASIAPLMAATGPQLWDDAGAPLQLEFGDSPLSLVRQTISGDSEIAQARLAETCQRIVESARQAPAGPAGAAELSLLAKADDTNRLAGEADAWSLHRVSGAFPLLAGVRTFPSDASDPAGVARRLVCCGMAFPIAEDRWTLYTFQSAAPADASPAGHTLQIPLPAGARRNLAVRDRAGGGMIGFAGRGQPRDWCDFFDTELSRHGWKLAQAWNTSESTWSARFASDQKADKGSIEIQFSGDETRGFSGLIHILPQ